MCAYVVYLGVTILVLIAAWGILGDRAFMWAIIILGPGAAAALLFLPKRGVQNAYRNWTRMQLLAVLLIGAGLLAATILLLARFAGPRTSDTIVYAGLLVPVILIVALVLLWGQLMVPTASRSRLRRQFPSVAEAIGRYRQRGDVDEKYTPALMLENKRHFLVFYHGNRGPSDVRGILLFDDLGRRSADEDLMRRAGLCKSLAVATVDYAQSEQRRKGIAAAETALAGVRGLYALLKAEKGRFSGMQSHVRDALETLLGAEQAVATALGTGRQIDLLVCGWAARHRLGSLTEVVDTEALELSRQIEEIRRPFVDGFPQWIEAYRAAATLAEAVREMVAMPRKGFVVQALLGLADSAKTMRPDVVAREYWALSERHWAAWRERMEYADEVDRGQLRSAPP